MSDLVGNQDCLFSHAKAHKPCLVSGIAVHTKDKLLDERQ